jgi:NodT family efflux transporter outer membrane factor (OMF) lipoprotein
MKLGALTASIVLLTAGCAVGPAYKRPPSPTPSAYKERPPAAETMRPATPGDDRSRGPWWEVFGDPDLNALESQVDVSSLTIAQAEAQYRGARAAARLARAGLFPTMTVGASAARSSGLGVAKTTSSGAPVAVTTYQLPVDFSWEADVFGRLRRTLEAATAGAQASNADLEAVRLATHAELAVDYFTLRALDSERHLLETTAAAYETTLTLTTNRYNQGVASGVDVAQAKTQLESARAQATDLRLARAQTEHALAVLLGKAPADFSVSMGQPLAEPPDVPVGLPSDLLERRPDVAAAERQVAAANAGIGIAQAAYFPTLTLSATGGYAGSSLSDLFSLPNRFWSIGAAALETIFSGGRRRAVKEEAVASYDAAVAAYQQSTLAAFQEVEDNLAALRDLREESLQQAAAVAAAEHVVALSKNRYEQGVTSYLEVVVAQAAALADERAAVDLSLRRMVAAVNLVKAVGGGWRASDLPDGKAILSRSEPRS